MKRIILVVTIILLIGIVQNSHAVDTWVSTPTVTVGWDAVTLNTNNTPVDPAKFKVVYDTYIKGSLGVPFPTGRVETLEKSIVFDIEDQWILGVEAVKILLADNSEAARSTISWSDNPVICKDGITFGNRYFLLPRMPIINYSIP